MKGSGGRSAFTIKEVAHDFPHDAAPNTWRAEWAWEDAELKLRRAPNRARARAPFGPGPTTLGTVCGPDPGAPVGVLK